MQEAWAGGRGPPGELGHECVGACLGVRAPVWGLARALEHRLLRDPLKEEHAGLWRAGAGLTGNVPGSFMPVPGVLGYAQGGERTFEV